MTHPTDTPTPVSPAPASSPSALIQVQSLTKDYALGRNVVHALVGVDLAVRPGEMVAVMGPSGSGKSTLLHILGCLDRPSAGHYRLGGLPVEQLTVRQLARLRNRRLGFVFQTFYLLPRATALENVMLPLLYAGLAGKAAQERSRQALALVGLADRASHRPNQLSGGQQQRVAIARSIVCGPALLLADEPTGNLDTRTSVEIMAIFQALNAAGLTIVLVTHEPDIAAYCPRTISFQDGRIVDDVANPQPKQARDLLPGANGEGASA